MLLILSTHVYLQDKIVFLQSKKSLLKSYIQQSVYLPKIMMQKNDTINYY